VIRFLRIGAIAIGALVGLVGVGVAALYGWSSHELGKRVALPPHSFTAPTDAAAVARGEHVLRALAKCSDCHGGDLGGSEMVNDPVFGRIFAPNLTGGAGSAVADYSDADYERAIRHGLAKDGRRLVIMPAPEYQYLSDDDLGTIVAYLRTLPPVDRGAPEMVIGPVARALFAARQLPLLPAVSVTHDNEVVPAVPIDTTVAYGKYIGDIGCAGCHGTTYGGGPMPGAPPDWPPTANLTKQGIGHYTFADFDRALRDGTRPDGSQLNPAMPVHATRLMTPVEMTAVWNYLQSLPPREYGTR
jgi:mono/diheme cytochrome c family protein